MIQCVGRMRGHHELPECSTSYVCVLLLAWPPVVRPRLSSLVIALLLREAVSSSKEVGVFVKGRQYVIDMSATASSYSHAVCKRASTGANFVCSSHVLMQAILVEYSSCGA